MLITLSTCSRRVFYFLNKIILGIFRTPDISKIQNSNNKNKNFDQCEVHMKILREFYFADLIIFVVCGNKFLWLKMTEVSAGN